MSGNYTSGIESPAVMTTAAMAVMVTISCVGFLGNSIVLFVYARKKEHLTANTFISSLAVTDLLACTIVIPMSITMERSRYRSTELMCRLYYLVNSSGIPFSSMLMTAIAVDRYLCICHPFLRLITVPRARCIVLTLGGLALTLGVTTATLCSAVVSRVNGTLQHADYGDCREIGDIGVADELTISQAKLVFYAVFQKAHLSLFGICISVVFVLYVKIYHSVLRLRRKRRRRRRRLPMTLETVKDRNLQQEKEEETPVQKDEDAEPKEEAAPVEENLLRSRRRSVRPAAESDVLQNLKTAAMLFVVAVVFVASFTPAALMMLRAVDFNILVFYLYYITHATNPIIYGFMNQNFRSDMRSLFCRT